MYWCHIDARRWKPSILQSFAWGLLGLLGVSCLALGLGLRDVSLPPRVPERLGNWSRILRALEAHPTDRPLSFAVVGDTKSFGTFDSILEALRGKDLDFIVNLGDFVHEPTPSEHSYFLHEMAEDLQPAGPPMLVIPGNHDVHPQSFPIAAFERLYGPSMFSFECAGNLFVFLNNALPRRKGGVNWKPYLKEVLSQRRQHVRRVFVLMHVPPMDPSRGWNGNGKSRTLEFLEQHGVDYAIGSHLHRYGRAQAGPTTVLVTGGGGATLKPAPFGGFHHAIVIRVAGDQVSEEIVPVSAKWKVAEKLEHMFMTVLLPLARHVEERHGSGDSGWVGADLPIRPTKGNIRSRSRHRA